MKTIRHYFTVISCDIDTQPGLISIVGIPNSMAIGKDPSDTNLAVLGRTAKLMPQVEAPELVNLTKNYYRNCHCNQMLRLPIMNSTSTS